jgi:VanZ family protein
MMMSKFEKYRAVPMILVMGTIFLLSHQPGDALDLPSIPGLDKAGHFGIYGLLAASVVLAHRSGSRKNNPWRVCLATLAVCLVYGISDEFHQSFIPGRFVSGADVLADMAGAVTVLSGWMISLKKGICRSVT